MKKDTRCYSVLVIEDNPGDFVLVEDYLAEQILTPAIVRAVSFKQAAAILSDPKNVFDVILLDLTLPDKNGEDLIIEMMRIAAACCPLIILTGYADIEFSIRSIAQGVSDYLLKDDLNPLTLYKSIIYAIERKEVLSRLKNSEKHYSDLFNLSPQPMWVFNMETLAFVQVNEAAVRLYGYSREEFMKMTLMDIKLEKDVANVKSDIINGTAINGIFKDTLKHITKSGDVIEVEVFGTPIEINSKILRAVVAIDVTEKNQYEHKMTRAIIKTQEDERYEIGGELHDNVCQLLAVSQMTLGMLKESIVPERTDLYNQGQEYIRMAMHEIRNLSHRLAPAFFDESTMEEAFRKLFAAFDIEEKFDIALHFGNTVNSYPLSLELQLNLYRILQEQLRNIQKYAKARLIEVDVLIHNDTLKMRVSDDGIGFNTDALTGGIGIANMKRRAELFSGNFNIISSPGKGCTIAIDIPLQEKSGLNKKEDMISYGIQQPAE